MLFKRLVTIGTLGVLTVASCGKDSSGPLSGSIQGSPFKLVGARTNTVDGNTVITLVNVPAGCTSAVTPTDGLITIEVAIPAAMLAPGTYSIGGSITGGVTKSTIPQGGSLKFSGTAFSSGSLVIQTVDGVIRGSLSVTGEGVSLDGSFNVPRCP